MNNRWIKKIIALSIVIALAGMLAACQPTAGSLEIEHESKREEVQVTDELRIMFVTPTVRHPIWMDAKYGAEQAGIELGVTVTWRGPEMYDPETTDDALIELVQQAIDERYDGIVLYPIHPDKFVNVMKRAQKENIPLVTVCGDSAPELRDSYVGTDTYKFGKEAAELIGERSGGRATLAIFCTDVTIINQKEELEAFKQTMQEDYPNVEIVTTRVDGTDVLKAVEETYVVLSEHPEVNYIWALEGAGAPGIVKVLKERGLQEDVTVLGTDSMEETITFIQEGDLWGSLAQDFYRMGKTSVENAVNHIKGNPVEDSTHPGFVFVTKENVDSYIAGKQELLAPHVRD